MRSAGAGKWSARCPGHDDSTPSLQVSLGDNGGVVMHDHGGCDIGQILSRVGLKITDLMPQDTSKRSATSTIADTYDYHAADGSLLYQVVRMVPKSFRQRHKDDGGAWVWNMDGVERVLYRLPSILKMDQGQTIFIVEGEKDANALVQLGLEATTAPGGAGKWREAYATPLIDRHVVIIADADTPGRLHAEQVRASVARVARSVKVIELPDAKDAFDWIAAGGNRERLEAILEDAPPPEPPYTPHVWTVPDLIRASIPEPEALVSGLCYRGGITLLAGRRGCGKTYVTLKTAGASAFGEDFGPLLIPRPARALYISQEMAENAIRKRIVRLFGNRQADTRILNLHIACRVKGIRLDSAEGAANLRALIESDGAEIVFLDALRNLKGSVKENDNDGMGDLMIRLQEDVADPTQAAFVLVHHMGKPREDGHRSGRGASALEDPAETVIYLEKGNDGNRSGLFDKTRDGGDYEGREFSYRIEEGEDGSIDVSMLLGERSDTHEDFELLKAVEFVQKAGGVMRMDELEKVMGWTDRTRARHVVRGETFKILERQRANLYGLGTGREWVVTIPDKHLTTGTPDNT